MTRSGDARARGRPSPSLLVMLLCAALPCGCGDADVAPPAEPPPPQRLVVPSAPEPSPELVPDVAEATVATARPGPGIEGATLATPVAPELPLELQVAALEVALLRTGGDAQAALDALGETSDAEHAVLRLERARCLLDLAAAAESHVARELRERARAHLDAAEGANADLPGAAVARARLAELEGDPDGAAAILAAHLDRFPGDGAAHAALGGLAFAAKDWALADTHLSLAADQRPSDGRLRLNATTAKQWLSAEGGAAYTKYVLRGGYREAARLLPEDDEPLRRMIGLYPERSPRRVAALDEVIADNPDAVRARVRKAALLLDPTEPDADAALAVLAAAAQIAPTDPDVLAATARTLRSAGRVADAVDAYVMALPNSEGNDALRLSNELDALLHPGDPDAGISLEQRLAGCDALVAANPTDGRFGNNAGFWFREQAKDYETSLTYYLAATQASPDDQDFLNDTGYLYLQHLRDWKERSEPLFLAARHLVEEDGQKPIRGYWDALEHLCRYYYEIGRYRDVLVCADLRASPDAKLGKSPYPSSSAASYRKKALAKLE